MLVNVAFNMHYHYDLYFYIHIRLHVIINSHFNSFGKEPSFMMRSPSIQMAPKCFKSQYIKALFSVCIARKNLRIMGWIKPMFTWIAPLFFINIMLKSEGHQNNGMKSTTCAGKTLCVCVCVWTKGFQTNTPY